MPKGARSNSSIFSSEWCGAWSVAITSTLPSAMPASIASRSAASRSGGFILRLVSYFGGPWSASSVSVKWCGATSHVTCTPRSLPARTARSDWRALMCAMCTCAAGQLRQRDVALDHQRFRHAGNPAQAERGGVVALVRDAIALERRILAVVDDRHAEHAGVLERAPHQQRRRDRPAVVGERDAAGGLLLAELGELLALRPERDRADRIHARQLRFGRLLEDELRDPGVVVDRVGVRHARDRRESAGDRRRRAGGDRLLVLLPRLAQVHVDVDEARGHDPAARHFEDLGALDRQVLADARDHAVLDQDIELAVPAIDGIDHPPVLQQ